MPDLPKVPVGRIRAALIALVVVAVALSSVFTVEPEEEALVLRFGEYQRTLQPGLHFKLPFGIERAQKVPVQRQLKQEFGFRTVKAGVRSQFSTSGYEDESNMLTGDLNAAVVQWVVQYRVVDSYKFLFRVRHVEDTFGDMAEAIMRTVVGDRTVNEVLTVGRQEIEDLVKVQLQELADQYETGIRVDQVVLQNVTPPEPVKPSFNEVNQAEQERERLINEAQSEYNRAVPRAEGEARQTIQQAEGYAINRTNRARGDAARFLALYESYRKAPEVTRTRIYLETMETILPRAGKKVVVDDDLEGLLPLLDLTGRSAAPPPSPQGGGGGE
ncbi:MAG: FtsH protease activity modulator HflK [Thermoanaerobaculia bacterium]|nr:FtsH protease activity modulator HflK [Thermoanaerobaculia bacterium]